MVFLGVSRRGYDIMVKPMESYRGIVLPNYITESYYETRLPSMLRNLMMALFYRSILRNYITEIYSGRYITAIYHCRYSTAGILLQLYYGTYTTTDIMADILRRMY